MRIRRRISPLLALAFASALAPRLAGAEPRTLVTDPELLTRLGFPPDARNIYLAEGVSFNPARATSALGEFGTADSGWITILGAQHSARASSTYDTVSGGGDIYPVSGSAFFDAQFHMPQGAVWEAVRWWGQDVAAQNAGVFVFTMCQPAEAGGPLDGTVVAMGGSVGEPGDLSLELVPAAPVVVDNRSCSYFTRTALSTIAGDTLILQRVRAQWRRQVSPAPLTATFPNDVPTTHPFFQFIEALAASGITAGCAQGSFCPQNPITRGEMAVFLAAALGLHWP
jgi:hypothetical protein